MSTPLAHPPAAPLPRTPTVEVAGAGLPGTTVGCDDVRSGCAAPLIPDELLVPELRRGTGRSELSQDHAGGRSSAGAR